MLERASAEIGAVFEGMARATDDACSHYSDAELELITGFLTRCGDIAEGQAGLLRRAGGAGADGGGAGKPGEGKESV